jgi:SAM-dependent methyltransferase
MVGSGTTIAVAARNGHEAVGFDTDPLAVLITKVWCSNVSKPAMKLLGARVVAAARIRAKRLATINAYPYGCRDEESKAFIRYWFDASNRRQLCALSRTIRQIKDREKREVLWCAFSKMIIRKKGGVSLGMDISHSRPHKVQTFSDHRALDFFERSLGNLLEALDQTSQGKTKPVVKLGDARHLPIKSKSVDMIITSPPYLDAIDYIRGHRLSLIWMGYSIWQLRKIRRENIGSEASRAINADHLDKIMAIMCQNRLLPRRLERMLKTYLSDLEKMLKETFRVLKPRGSATFVIGNSIVRGVYIKNAIALAELGRAAGLKLRHCKMRRLPNNRRYLPPPSKNAGAMSNRMRTETVLTFSK